MVAIASTMAVMVASTALTNARFAVARGSEAAFLRRRRGGRGGIIQRSAQSSRPQLRGHRRCLRVLPAGRGFHCSGGSGHDGCCSVACAGDADELELPSPVVAGFISATQYWQTRQAAAAIGNGEGRQRAEHDAEDGDDGSGSEYNASTADASASEDEEDEDRRGVKRSLAEACTSDSSGGDDIEDRPLSLRRKRIRQRKGGAPQTPLSEAVAEDTEVDDEEDDAEEDDDREEVEGRKGKRKQRGAEQKKRPRRAAPTALWKRSRDDEACLQGFAGPEDMEAWERSVGHWGDDDNAEEAAVDPDALVQRKEPLPKREPPPELLMPLLPFQKEWLAWSLRQEDTPVKGGILADEMGMGKTIQAISLIAAGRHVSRPAGHALCSLWPGVAPLPPEALGAPPAAPNNTVTGSAPVRQPSARAAARRMSASDINRVSAGALLAAELGVAVPATQAKSPPPPSAPEVQLPQVKATLVVCPLVAVIQWRQEVARFTSPGSMRVLVYHGPKRAISAEELAAYDVVLTTYAIVEAEYRRHVKPDKEACRWCARRYYPDRLRLHLKYFCGPGAKRSDRQAKTQKKRPAKFLAALAFGKAGTSAARGTLEEVAEEEEDCSDSNSEEGGGEHQKQGKGKALATARKGQGSSRGGGGRGRGRGRGRRGWGGRGGSRISVGDLRAAVEVAVVEAELDAELAAAPSSASPGTARPASVLHAYRWARIVLDEAHSIKDRRCSTAKAVFALQSEFKWALSGTPLQNRVGELYSLVRFLQIEPYSYYFCRKCDCKSLDYSFGKDWRKCDHCGHGPLHHFCWWNKYVANPIKKWGYVADGRRAMMLLKHRVLDQTLLRRTKVERAADLTLPPRTTVLRKDAFDAKEEDFYQALYTQSQSQFATYVDSGTVLNNYAHIFDLLIRLRQAVDHPYLVVHSASGSQGVAQTSQALVQEPQRAASAGICGICHDPVEDSVVTACDHPFCRTCLQEYVSAAGGSAETAGAAAGPPAVLAAPQCPTCQKPLTVDLASPSGASAEYANSPAKAGGGYGRRAKSILARIDLSKYQSSTKIEALREEIAVMMEKDPSAKCLVFSQFTSMLELISFRLKQVGIVCVKLDGSMTMEARDRMIKAFTDDPDCKVFLMSLKAGGVALNLTVASQVFLMDPWWNPAVEQQAQDRIHRLGQYKPIVVTRFVIENTIEERILKLQEKKQLVFEGTVGGSAEALGRLTEDDMRFLFSN
eukprot:SM000004S14992  [mRNA]  locus=s4:637588:643739:- [translate_table: standard]